MTVQFEHDRIAQLLLEHDIGTDVDLARARLEGGQVQLSIDAAAAATQWGQAAALAIAATASRMFRGGVFIGGLDPVPVIVGSHVGAPLMRALEAAGCRSRNIPAKPYRLHIGSHPQSAADLYLTVSGWRAHVAPYPAQSEGKGNVIAGAAAGALAVSEAFRRHILGDLLAGRQPLTLSLWDPAAPEIDPGDITRLPASLWLLGLGNLGQATMFLLELLPFADRRLTHLLVQDRDRVGEENRLTQILTEPAWIGHRKARMLGAYADRLGFETRICERSFGASSRPEDGEPRVALAGVDNLDARRLAADGRFDLVIDAGLGSSAEEIFDLRLHAFPGRMTPQTAWPDVTGPTEAALNPGLEKLVVEGRLPQCGALAIAGQSLGVPSTAVVAAALQVGQLCRALASGTYCDFVDLTLRNPKAVVATSAMLPDNVSLPSVMPRP
ncbi:hypothetical protein CDQ92_02120 [Sphingopyxis bauzanensis]|uniref:Thiamine biosynthesis protein ThiF n=1 Tax=Sphingopyxis bauzanensis TaxID=651663 RepID=A0A246K0F2_9SPHN|nr:MULTISPECIES: hypothetical protein [Sphingopyxis]OWQ98995.1 hypothetical protein CDQ92_02120 [Sphingopyxis bauzanensis]GGJ59790.1 hypothetical protein GCM10011393_32670 [Sphingopyxis bauzanensis]